MESMAVTGWPDADSGWSLPLTRLILASVLGCLLVAFVGQFAFDRHLKGTRLTERMIRLRSPNAQLNSSLEDGS
jgi:hypothetical protein